MSAHPLQRHLLPLLALLLITSCKGQAREDGIKDPVASDRTAYPLEVLLKDSSAAPRERDETHAPKSITRNVLQDRKGIYWLATWEGIIRYDGQRFTNVTLSEGLEKFRVFSLLEDAAGILWFGTIGGGVYRYDGSAFVRYTTSDGLAHNSILSMLQDDAGNIWFGTDSGASRYDGKAFTHFPIQDGPGINVNAMAQDSSGKIWFATRYGVETDLYCYDGKTFAPLERSPGTRFWNVRTVMVDVAGTIWTGGQDGLVRYHDGSFTQVSPHFIGYIFEDRAGNLWLSEDSPGDGWALKRSDGTTSTVITTRSMIFGTTEDAAGNIWYGAMDGVGRYDGRAVTHFTE